MLTVTLPGDETVTAEPTGAAMRTVARSITRTAVQVADLTESITSGRVVLDPEAGESLLAALRAQADDVDGWLDRIAGMTTPLPLGANTVGTAMAGKFAGRADGEGISFGAVLTSYRTLLDSASTAVADAMRSYRDTESANSGDFRTIQGRI